MTSTEIHKLSRRFFDPNYDADPITFFTNISKQLDISTSKDLIQDTIYFILEFLGDSSIAVNSRTSVLTYLKSLQPILGIKQSVKLYRGMSWDLDHPGKYKVLIKNILSQGDKGIVDIPVQLSSWTHDYRVAKLFALNLTEHNLPIVVSHVFNTKDILLQVSKLPSQIQSYSKQSEVIVLPGIYTCDFEVLGKMPDEDFESEYARSMLMRSEVYETSLKDLHNFGILYSDVVESLNHRSEFSDRHDIGHPKSLGEFLNKRLVKALQFYPLDQMVLELKEIYPTIYPPKYIRDEAFVNYINLCARPQEGFLSCVRKTVDVKRATVNVVYKLGGQISPNIYKKLFKLGNLKSR